MKALFLLLILSVSGSAFADPVPTYQEMIDQYSYDFVMSTCHDQTTADSKYFIDRMWTMTYAVSADGLKRDFIEISDNDNRGISFELNRLLNSAGYYKGLRDCYPHSEKKRDRYTRNLLIMDIGGTTLGTTALVGGSYVVLVGGGSLISYYATAIVTRMGISAVRAKIAGWGLTAFFAGQGAQEALEDYKNQTDVDKLKEKEAAENFDKKKEDVEFFEYFSDRVAKRLKFEGKVDWLFQSLTKELRDMCDQLKDHNASKVEMDYDQNICKSLPPAIATK